MNRHNYNIYLGDIANDTLVTICNNFIHSLFKQINVRLNGTLISPQTDTYHNKAFIDTVIHNDRDDGETILKPEGWFNGLTCRDASGTALTANQLNPAHDDFKALSQVSKIGLNPLNRLMAVLKWCFGSNLTSKCFNSANC